MIQAALLTGWLVIRLSFLFNKYLVFSTPGLAPESPEYFIMKMFTEARRGIQKYKVEKK